MPFISSFPPSSCYCPAPPLVSILELLQLLPPLPLGLPWWWPACNAQSSDPCDNSPSKRGLLNWRLGSKPWFSASKYDYFFLYCCQNGDVRHVKVKTTQLLTILLGKPILHRNDESSFIQATSQEGFYPKQILLNIWGLVCHSTSDCFHLCPSCRLGWHYQLIKQ